MRIFTMNISYTYFWQDGGYTIAFFFLKQKQKTTNISQRIWKKIVIKLQNIESLLRTPSFLELNNFLNLYMSGFDW